MVEVNISENQIKRAKELYPFGNLNGSITEGKGNIFGAMGEIVVFDYFKKYNPVFKSTYNYDMIIQGLKIDVKTKRTTVTPLPHYLCSISDFNTEQDCDYYFFLRVSEHMNVAYILGYMKKEEFFKKAFFVRKGDRDVNGFIFKDDCYNLKISDLYID